MLKQRKLGLALLRCFSVNERSPTGQAVLNYLKPASGKAAGNFALLVTEVSTAPSRPWQVLAPGLLVPCAATPAPPLVQRLFKDMCSLQDGADPRVRELKVGDVNAKLDELAAAAGKAGGQVADFIGRIGVGTLLMRCASAFVNCRRLCR